MSFVCFSGGVNQRKIKLGEAGEKVIANWKKFHGSIWYLLPRFRHYCKSLLCMGGKEDSGDRQLLTKLHVIFIFIYSASAFQHSSQLSISLPPLFVAPGKTNKTCQDPTCRAQTSENHHALLLVQSPLTMPLLPQFIVLSKLHISCPVTHF